MTKLILDFERQAVRERARRAGRSFMLAGTLEMAMGLLILVGFFPMFGRGVYHIVASLSVVAGGVVINVIGLRALRRAG
jgi:hypothetical protein